MKKKMSIHYDPEGDYLEVRFGEPTPAYFDSVGSDIFARIDRKTKDIRGYAIFNVKKREVEKQHKDIEVELPAIITS